MRVRSRRYRGHWTGGQLRVASTFEMQVKNVHVLGKFCFFSRCTVYTICHSVKNCSSSFIFKLRLIALRYYNHWYEFALFSQMHSRPCRAVHYYLVYNNARHGTVDCWQQCLRENSAQTVAQEEVWPSIIQPNGLNVAYRLCIRVLSST